MPTPEKEALVVELREAVEKSTGMYLADFHHLSVAEMSELRGQILQNDACLRVAKNRLLKLAFAGTDAEGLQEFLTGPTAVAFCQADPITVIKTLTSFGQDHEYLAVKAALFDGQIFDREQVARLALLPPHDQLLAMVLAGLAGPVTGLVNLLDGVTSQFVFTLQAIADKRKEQEPQPTEPSVEEEEGESAEKPVEPSVEEEEDESADKPVEPSVEEPIEESAEQPPAEPEED